MDAIKRKIAKAHKIECPSNVELLKAYHKLVGNKTINPKKNLEILLRKRGVRSLSGVVIVSVLTKPYPCPGNCLYCPSQKGIPKSYLDNEPAVMRAVMANFNPYLQVKRRLKTLELTGHPTDKIELIVIGGTWSYLPSRYQNWFIKRCFDACNKKTSGTLEKAQQTNETARHRIIGITLETRPDFINKEEIKKMRKLGCTRIELGVQSIYDKILKKNLRGHNIKTTKKATKLLKDAGLKVCYHMMPNLPGSNLKKDYKMFKELFKNPEFRPDLLKIYPCAILKEAPLYRLWLKNKYKPYTEYQLKGLVKKIKKIIPYYVRIQRITRDIPASSIVVGPAKISNLRQVLQKEIKKDGWQCKCIRCREVRQEYCPKEKLVLFRQDYRASEGKEIFLSFEDQKRERLYSLLRLRIPSQIFSRKKHFIPALNNSSLIRELHTYGQLNPLSGDQSFISPQHKGLGKKLITEAERITKKEFSLNKISVIAGIGVRNYYKKLGYKLEDSYMSKNLSTLYSAV